MADTMLTTDRVQLKYGKYMTGPKLRDALLTATASENTLGAELVTNWDFTDITTGWTAGAGWSYSGGDALHTTGNVGKLTSASCATVTGGHYRLQIVVGQFVASTCSVTVSNSSGMTFADFGTAGLTVYFTASGNGSVIEITPNTLFNGSIVSVSLMRVTSAAIGCLNVYNADNTIGNFRVKAGGTGLNNIFVGGSVGDYNLTGINNVALGLTVFVHNVSGGYNVAIGKDTLHNNVSGSQNIGFGYAALYSNLEGSFNIAVGYESETALTTGTYNVGIGRASLAAATTGSHNIAIGYLCGDNLTTGSRNIIIGYDIAAPAVDSNDTLNIGNLIHGTQAAAVANQRLGFFDVTTPVAQAAHIADAATDITAANAAINAILVVLENLGFVKKT